MRICLFDIDGTLITTGGSGGRAMLSAVAEQFAVQVPEMEIPFAGRSDRAIVGDIFSAVDVETTDANWTVFRRTYLKHLQRELQMSTGRVLEGVVPLLNQLQAASRVELGLLTGNLEQGAWTKLRHYDIAHYFDFGGFGDTHPHRDDIAREAASAVEERFGAADEVVVIGDTPADVQCGRAIQAVTIAVATGTYSADELAATGPDHLFENLDQASDFFSDFAA